jgi:hypothetical protein
MTQVTAVLHYLQRHKEGITSLDAYSGKVCDDDGNTIIITRLSDIIYKLRRDGYKLSNVEEKYVNKNGNESRYVRYRLVPDPMEKSNEKTKVHFYK